MNSNFLRAVDLSETRQQSLYICRHCRPWCLGFHLCGPTFLEPLDQWSGLLTRRLASPLFTCKSHLSGISEWPTLILAQTCLIGLWATAFWCKNTHTSFVICPLTSLNYPFLRASPRPWQTHRSFWSDLCWELVCRSFLLRIGLYRCHCLREIIHPCPLLAHIQQDKHETSDCNIGNVCIHVGHGYCAGPGVSPSCPNVRS